MLTDEQLLRYSRQIMLPEIDIAGQEKILKSRVLVLGLGGLGSPVAMYLTAAGVGELVLVDDDQVDLSNLQRQIVHNTESIGVNKVDSAKQSLQALNPEINIITIAERLSEKEFSAWVKKVDLVLDCSDNFSTRFAVNRTCVKNKTPLVSGAAIRMEGQVAVFDSRQPNSPCYQCLYPTSNDEELTCSEAGVIAPLVGVIGSIQALEALKVLANFGAPLTGKLLVLDALSMNWRQLNLTQDDSCTVCALSN